MKLEPLDIVDGRTSFQKWHDGDGPPSRPSYVYVASSWRNPLQVGVVGAIRAAGIDCYDFRNPADGEHGFNWREIDPDWESWTPEAWRSALDHPISRKGFALDKSGMDRADCGILVLPCGRSAHMEAGYMAARDVPILTLCLERTEPELMILLLGPSRNICVSMDELLEKLGV